MGTLLGVRRLLHLVAVAFVLGVPSFAPAVLLV